MLSLILMYLYWMLLSGVERWTTSHTAFLPGISVVFTSLVALCLEVYMCKACVIHDFKRNLGLQFLKTLWTLYLVHIKHVQNMTDSFMSMEMHQPRASLYKLYWSETYYQLYELFFFHRFNVDWNLLHFRGIEPSIFTICLWMVVLILRAAPV